VTQIQFFIFVFILFVVILMWILVSIGMIQRIRLSTEIRKEKNWKNVFFFYRTEMENLYFYFYLNFLQNSIFLYRFMLTMLTRLLFFLDIITYLVHQLFY